MELFTSNRKYRLLTFYTQDYLSGKIKYHVGVFNTELGKEETELHFNSLDEVNKGAYELLKHYEDIKEGINK